MFLRGRGCWPAALAIALLLMSGCSGGGSGGDSDTVRIGWLSTVSGVYESQGTDMRDGFELYLDLHDGRLGGRRVELLVADEGDGPTTALPAAERLVRAERVVADRKSVV